MRAAHERLADVSHGEHARRLNIIPILLRERVNTARRANTWRQSSSHRHSASPKRASIASPSPSPASSSRALARPSRPPSTVAILIHRLAPSRASSRFARVRHPPRRRPSSSSSRVPLSPVASIDPLPVASRVASRSFAVASRTHAFFFPPFLPLDMRLFFPTAMTRDRCARRKGGPARSSARVRFVARRRRLGSIDAPSIARRSRSTHHRSREKRVRSIARDRDSSLHRRIERIIRKRVNEGFARASTAAGPPEARAHVVARASTTIDDARDFDRSTAEGVVHDATRDATRARTDRRGSSVVESDTRKSDARTKRCASRARARASSRARDARDATGDARGRDGRRGGARIGRRGRRMMIFNLTRARCRRSAAAARARRNHRGGG